jgi:tetratricopeptide (TPR) repeat protein
MAIVRNSILGIVAACVAQGTVSAQNGEKQLFDEAFRALMLNNQDLALEKLQAIIKLNPSNEQAINLYAKTDGERWREMLLQGGEIEKLAQHLIQLAKQGRVELSQDTDAIQALVAKATAEASGFAGRREARQEILNKHGEFAVPSLLAVLGDHDNDQGQLSANIALRELGRAATLAMIEATHSSNATMRRGIASVFNYTKDHRAIPALTSMLAGANEGVTEVATAALASMGASATGDAVQLFVAQSQNYMVGVGTSGMDVSSVVWGFADGALSSKACDPAVYQFELAKRSAERALSLDPSSAAATALVARSYLAQVAAIENGKIEGLEAVKANLNMVAMAMGPQVLGSALEDSIRDNQPMVAAAAIGALGSTTDRDALSNSPLLSALDSSNKIVKYAAALALTEASRASNVPNSDKVVAVLANAIAEQAEKRVAIVGLDSSNEKVARNAQSARTGEAISGVMKDIKDTAERFLTQAVAADVVVINEVLPDGAPETIMDIFKHDDRTSHMKVIIVAKDADKAAERFGDKIAGVIQAGFKPADLQAKVNEALEGVDMSSINARAAKVAKDASVALHTLASNRVDVSGAVASLEAQLQRDDSVSIPSANALGEAGTGIGALVGQVTGDGSGELKVACANASGKILGRGVAISDAQFSALKGVATSADADTALRIAVTTALGKAKLNPGQKLQLVQALSTMAVSGGDE